MVYKYDESWKPLFDKWKSEIDVILEDAYNVNYKFKSYPPKEVVFKAFEMPVKDIKLVQIYQDPYHGEGQAMGLAVSVPKNIPIPPSLNNIFKELNNEFPERNYNFTHGDLTNWAENENIFLLNCALTVIHGNPLSHMKKWEAFTNDVIKFIVDYNDICVFLLLGSYAKNKSKIINNENRCVKGVHPSPLSAYCGFFNSNLFKNIEEKIGKINWQN